MAVTTTAMSSGLAANIVRDADCNATSEDNVRSGAATVYAVDIDNTANAAISYIKFYDSAAPTVGTTAPVMILPAPASTRQIFLMPQGLASIFATALSFAGLTAGGTAGTTGPTSDVIVLVATN